MKKIKIFSVFIIFTLCFLCHFAYDFMPNFITSIIFPVNESIFEHMKIILTSYLLYSILDYFLLKKYDINNFVLQMFLVPFIGIFVYLIIYIPLFNLLGENMFVSISLLFLVIVLEAYLSYKLLNYEHIKNGRILGIIGIIALYFMFGYLTYYPPTNYLFKDFKTNTYGI